MRKLCERSGRYSFTRCQPDRRYSADTKNRYIKAWRDMNKEKGREGKKTDPGYVDSSDEGSSSEDEDDDEDEEMDDSIGYNAELSAGVRNHHSIRENRRTGL